MNEPTILREQDPLDYELTALLGLEPHNYIVLRADGATVPFFGTPPDSPANRAVQQRLVDGLNDRGEDSWWPEFFNNWRVKICGAYNLSPDTTAKDFRPQFTWAITAACMGYVEHQHVAFGLFSGLGDRLKSWSVSKEEGEFDVRLTNRHGLKYWETGTDLPRVICLAVKRLLKDLPE